MNKNVGMITVAACECNYGLVIFDPPLRLPHDSDLSSLGSIVASEALQKRTFMADKPEIRAQYFEVVRNMIIEHDGSGLREVLETSLDSYLEEPQRAFIIDPNLN